MNKYDNRDVPAFNSSVAATICFISVNLFCLLGVSTGVLATVPSGKTASEAVADINRILGDPEVFVGDIWDGVNGFVSEHFGSMAVATGFGIAVRTITK